MTAAKERLNSAKILLDNNNYKDSIGRSYYAMFTSVRALLAIDGVDYSKHAGVIAYFQKEYIKTGVFEKKYSKYLSQAFQIRNNTDYADFFIASQADAKEQYEKALEFNEVIEGYLQNNVDRFERDNDLEVERVLYAMHEISENAQKSGVADMSLEEINEEIDSARKERE